MKTLTIVLLSLFLAGPAFAICPTPPKDGAYSTMAGTILPGRASEAWCTAMSPGVPGNTENAMSWNGSALGTQWHVWGMQIDGNGAVEKARDIDTFGNGWIDYVTNYTGGSFWLSGAGPWGYGAPDYTGTLTYYNVSTRVSYFGGQMVGATSNVMFRGIFAECEQCSLEYVITNAMFMWRTGMSNQPANYPSFLCGAAAGEYFDVCCILAKISCLPVPVEPTNWGAIKEMYKE